MSFKSKAYGKYILLDRIAVGGMAEVFKAKTFGVHGFKRFLVIKRILPHLSQDEEFVEMFIDEAKIAVELSHANICQVSDLGKLEGNYFIAMEYINGKDLRAILKKAQQAQSPINIPMALFISIEILKGLDYAHSKKDTFSGTPLNLIHRDISPQNIMLSFDGEVKIVDFGIAKTESKIHRTQAGVLKGKFGYMSPEQAAGLELDQKTDLFSTGIILYEMITGQRLFHEDSDFKTLEAIKNCKIPSVIQYNPDVSEELEKIILKSLAQDPQDRFESAQNMQVELSKIFFNNYANFSTKDLGAYLQNLFQAEIKVEQENLKRALDTLNIRHIEQAEKAAQSDHDSTLSSLSNTQSIVKNLTKSNIVQKSVGFFHKAKNFVLGFKQLNLKQKASAILIALTFTFLIFSVFGNFGNKQTKDKVSVATENIAISSVPEGANIIIDNEEKGFTPLSLPFEANKVYEFKVSLDGYNDIVDQVLIKSGQRNLKFELEEKVLPSTSLFIDSVPQGAKININGEFINQVTPTTVYKLTQGTEYNIILEKEGFKPQGQTIIPQKNIEEVFLKLEPTPSTVKINISPESAKIYLDGKEVGKTIENLEPSTSYTFKFSAPGYVSVTREITPSNSLFELDIALKRVAVAKGIINLSAIPWANVKLNGKKIGTTPILNYSLNVGTYTFVFEHQDFKPITKKVKVTQGQNAPIIVNFESP
ncbi:MAG TPA: serine/threonine-protein kinase [Oligoflexia bacterium]|nr:serine/threonine-protein kinase [Oligoflexia bacterium]HMR24157.1 serine/threonine-protein kinase [Oligoflexia bacterium]